MPKSLFHSPDAGRGPPLPQLPGMSMATTFAPNCSSLAHGPMAEPAPIKTKCAPLNEPPPAKKSDVHWIASAASRSTTPPDTQRSSCDFSAAPVIVATGGLGVDGCQPPS